MKLSLYSIEKEYLELASQIIDNYGETTPELDQALAINKDNLQVKAASYAYVTKDIDHEITAIDSEIGRLQALKASRVKTIDKLKETIKTAMELYKMEIIESNNIKLSFTKSAETVIEDESLIPAKYKTKKVTYSISKAAIKNDLNAGKKVKGAYINNKKNLQIK